MTTVALAGLETPYITSNSAENIELERGQFVHVKDGYVLYSEFLFSDRQNCDAMSTVSSVTDSYYGVR